MKRLRVLQVIPKLCEGGAEVLVKDLVKFFDASKIEVAVCSFYAREGLYLEKEVEKNDCRVFYLRKQFGIDLRVPFQFKKVLREFQPDVVHGHLRVLRYIAAPVSSCRVKGRVHTVHNPAKEEADGLFGTVERWIAYRQLGFQPVGLSKMNAKSVEQYYGVKHVPEVLNGIPIESYFRSPEQRFLMRRDLGFGGDEFVLIHIGRFAPQKNHAQLIEAFDIVRKKIPQARLLLVGTGKEYDAVVEEVARRELAGVVQFLGARGDVPDLLNAADLFVLSSRFEGIPITVLEAMATKRPMVLPKVGGIPEMVDDGVTATLVNPGDPRVLADAIVGVHGDRESATKMADRAYERCNREFHIRTTADKYAALYQKLVENR